MMKTQELVTVRPLLEAATRRLDAAAVETPRLDARLLMSAASGRSLEALVAEPERALSEDERRQFEALIARRLQREPVARILGRREFWSLPFRLGPAVFVPRPESETLVEAALELAAAGGCTLKVLDLRTGSGWLLLGVLDARAGAEGIGVDLSEAASSIARENAAALGLSARAR